ncbi:hypothetical protein [Saccharolobus caldissimus]|uniref:PaREP6 n=1 Tax=Saccharolobus caldissimus TaxID=1702097 RepID=A0AAQ4CTJ0_9CREN|nr:hypothetical protein [Saccharolobus caldissimus]BDB99121.1 hypothetical protein SACC_21380 [Saccharolobus caldissimus]
MDEIKEYEDEAREIRRKYANWDFINSLPPRLKYAVTLYIEKGDLRLSQKLSGLDLEDFKELLIKCNVPTTYY